MPGGRRDPAVQPKVSVVMVTYRHERFLAQAIESVLMQETDFPFELVIGEDASPDGTRRIAEDYQRRHGDTIRLLARERNLGAARNFVGAYRTCRGLYVANLEGDDYWTDPKKLQRQADALDAHPDWVICFHQVRCFYEDGREPAHLFPTGANEVSSLDDLLQSNFVPNCSLMFRNGVVQQFPAWYFTLALGDWPLSIMLAQHGKLGYLDEVMADYRLHEGGIWSGKDELFHSERIAEMLGWVRQLLDVDRAAQVTERVVEDYLRLARRYMGRGDAAKARSTLRGVLRRESVLRRRYPHQLLLRALVQVEAPLLFRMASRIRRLVRSRLRPGKSTNSPDP